MRTESASTEPKTGKRICSFDFFDTIATRLFFKPQDLFLAVGVGLKKRGIIPDVHSWAELRQRVERDLRRVGTRKEVTLDEIYEALGKQCGWDKEVIQFSRQYEAHLERKFIRPVGAVRDEIAKKMRCNSRCVIVSDTYFSSGELVELAAELGVELDEQSVFASSEYRETKECGRLFDVVNGALSPDRIDCHTGDNPHSDVLRARKAGLTSIHFTLSYPTRYELQFYEAGSFRSISSAVAGAARAVRLSRHWDGDGVHNIFWAVGSDVMGPLLVGYVLWLLLDAKRRGFSTLYFVARDGWIMREVAQRLDVWLQTGIKLRYIYGSRQAWHLPGLTDFDGRSADWVFENWESLPPEEIFARVGITWDEISSIRLRHRLGERYRHDIGSRVILELLKEIFSDAAFVSLVRSRGRGRRGMLAKYLTQEGFSDNETAALVDIGWQARMQSSLKRVLLEERVPTKLFGYYMGLSHKVAPDCVAESISYLPESMWIAQSFHQNRTLAELMCSVAHGTTLGYENREGGAIRPILANLKLSSESGWLDKLQIQQEAILEFAQQFVCAAVALDVEPESAAKFLRVKAVNGWNLFASKPSVEEARAYGEIVHDHEQGRSRNGCVNVLAPRLSWGNFFQTLLRSPKAAFSISRWLEGSAVRSTPSGLITLAMLTVRVRMFLLFLLRRIAAFNLTKWLSTGHP